MFLLYKAKHLVRLENYVELTSPVSTLEHRVSRIMGNCLYSACVLLRRLNFLPNCLISSDDQVEHPELPENGSISHADKRNEFPKNGLISPADDHINQQESPVNGLVSPIVDQGNHVESNFNLSEGGLVSVHYIVQQLEWLENGKDLMGHIKEQIQILEMELKFVSTYFTAMEGKNDHASREAVEAFVQSASSELSSLLLRTTDGSLSGDLMPLISTMQEQMNDCKAEIRFYYASAYFESQRNTPTKNEIVMKLVDLLLENLKDLQICKTNSITLLRNGIEALEEKLLFIQNFFRLTTKGTPLSLPAREDGIEHEKHGNHLAKIEYVVDNAVYLSYFCLVEDRDEDVHLKHVRLKCNISYLVQTIKQMEPELKEICVSFRKDLNSSYFETLPIDLQIVVAIDCLLDNLVQLRNCESQFMASVNDNLLILYDELMFLRALLMDPPPRKHREYEKMHSLLKNVEPLFSEAGSVISTFSNEMEVETANKMNLIISAVIKRINLIKSEVRKSYTRRLNHLQLNSTGMEGVHCVDFLLKNMGELLNCEADSVGLKHQIESVYNELTSLRSSLEDIAMIIEKHDLNALVKRVIDVAQKAEYIINSCVVGDCPIWSHIFWISDLKEEIRIIKEEVKDICKNKYYRTTKTSAEKTTPLSFTQSRAPVIEVVIGFEDEANKILERLIGGSTQLDVVSIVGMPGLVKTTLAKKVYDHPLVASYFYVRAWCCVTQSYKRRELLLDILSHVIELTDKFYKMSDEDLAEVLYRGLKGMKYLIFMDDMWNINAWDDLRRFFPNDKSGSRIMITTRILDTALKVKPDSSPHLLRLFSEEESWKLFQEKLFQQEKCTEELVDVGKEIARKCNRLPLAVVVIAGLLAKMDKKYDQWKKVADGMSSFIVSDSRQYMDILELSYNHLPHHLKPCFLYFGAFAAGKQISVKKLLLLWIAEGFIQDSKLKTIEDEADNYLMDLVGRSLIIVDQKRSKGGVKTCHVHDLLHDLCLLKAKKENFLQLINGHDELYAPYLGDSDDMPNDYGNFSSFPQQVRLSIYCKRTDFLAWKPATRQVRALLFFATDDWHSERWIYPSDFSFIFYSLKLLKELDLSSVNVGDTFPSGIEFLVHLRYLAIRGGMGSIPSSIAKLVNLEVLFVKGVKGEIVLPTTEWGMASLRHLHIEPRAALSLPNGKPVSIRQNMKTLCTPCFSYGYHTTNLIRALQSLQKLKCIFTESWEPYSDINQFPVLSSLYQLESLKVFYQGRVRKAPNFNFPLNLKKLTLAKFCLPWSAISEFGRLPNLEVLKLLFRAFDGERWDAKDDEFLKLKYLKLDSLNLVQWNASSDHFPRLERLVLHRCKQLEEIPCDFGGIPTLQLIEMKWCSHSVADSAKQIQEEQKDYGNEELEVIIKTSS